MNEWKDITSYSQRDNNKRETKSLALHVDYFRIVVTRILHVDNEWFLTCHPFFSQKPLGSIPLDEAKRIALHLVRQKLTAALEGIPREAE